MFVEFDTSCQFAEGVADVICSCDIFVDDLFFVCPLEDDHLFNVDMSCITCRLLSICEVSGASVIDLYFGWLFLCKSDFI